MNEVSKALLHKASLRKACSGFSLDEIEKVLADLNDLAKARRDEVKALKAKAAAKQKKMAAIRKKLEQSGLDIQDVISAMKGAKSVQAKYRFVDKDGKIHTWSGRGRTPKIFQQLIDKGHTKDEYLIRH